MPDVPGPMATSSNRKLHHCLPGHGVSAPQPAPDHDTTSRRYQCYHEATAPRPPEHILPFCCPRIFLADSAHAASDAAWQELPDRHMHWAPTYQRQSGRWAPEWVCMRCNSTVDEHHPLLQAVPEPPECPAHGPRRLVVDMCERSRGWVCCRGSPPQVLPCPGQRLPMPEVPHAAPPAAPTTAEALPADSAWFCEGPPDTRAIQRTHSWLFVPLLHAAVGRLDPTPLARWEAHPLYGRLWQHSLALLRQAPPVEPQALVHALHTLQQLASEEGRALPAPEAQLLLVLAAESPRLPSNTQVHLAWAWRFATLPDGYIPASAQEALLHMYMGERAAASLLQDVAASHRDPGFASTDPPGPLPTILLPHRCVLPDAAALRAPARRAHPPPPAADPQRSRLHSLQLHPAHQAPLILSLAPPLPTTCTVRGSRPPSLVLTPSMPRTSSCSRAACSSCAELSSCHSNSSAKRPLPMHLMRQSLSRPAGLGNCFCSCPDSCCSGQQGP